MTPYPPGLGASLLVVLPLALALVTYVAGTRLRPILVWLAPLLVAALAGTQVCALIANGSYVYDIGGWAAPLGITWRIDGLAVAMLAITAMVMGATCVYASGYFADPHQAAGRREQALFWPLTYLLWGTLNALFLSADIFNLYVTLELLTLGSVGLIMLAGTPESLAAALRYLLLGLMASLFYLMGVILIYATYGALDMAWLGSHVQADLPTGIAVGLMIAGLLIKTALFPMHFWLPPAHASAPAPVSALLSALVIKASFYLTARLWFDVFQTQAQPLAAQFLGALGACAIVWGAVQALQADRLKLLVAYSTVAQLGYLFLLFPLASTPTMAKTAWLGAMLFALSHALAKAAMFLAAGTIGLASGDDRLERLRGIGQNMPLTVSATALAGVSLMGLPPSGGFAAKWLLLLASVRDGQWWWALVLVVGGLLTAAYLFRFWRIAIATAEPAAQRIPVGWRLELPPLALAIAAVLMMFLTSPVVALLEIDAGFAAGSTGEVAQ